MNQVRKAADVAALEVENARLEYEQSNNPRVTGEWDAIEERARKLEQERDHWQREAKLSGEALLDAVKQRDQLCEIILSFLDHKSTSRLVSELNYAGVKCD